ncbi:hypothetical protein CVO77_01445 [Sphingopyxis lindanitolerans]|uniref:Nucleotidyltransferase family protein n=1 Tax=Sphingopyxis lindanitolerans TaxID=2054227 RepID=A0A2S8BB03_9SPHN|nr:nucleotidyltransferase family protein [Sphingopyxis lindanitolerans]PQM29604.1 hypothetical protein CVO77_01445 [Sphingopyxis lindanitolerans]
MSAIHIFVDLLAGRREAASLAPREWDGVITVARAEAMLATLAHWLKDSGLPPSVAALFADQRAAVAVARTQSLWEAEMARRALASERIEFVLLKGTAYAAAGLSCAEGRQIGDLDILVLGIDIGRAENELLEAGWEWVKSDPYDDAYYREHMHELPPLIHKARDRMIDVHHTILPQTHRVTPDPLVLMAEAVETPTGFRVLSPPAMACHCAAHLLADGDLQGGLRNLWDFHCLVGDFLKDDPQFHRTLLDEARRHGLSAVVRRALRLSNHLYGTPLIAYEEPFPLRYKAERADDLFIQRLLARDDWGRPTHFALHQAFYIRSHWLRMPPLLLTRHLWTKWRKG